MPVSTLMPFISTASSATSKVAGFLLKYFDRLYLSYECKVMKPSPEIFRMMLEGQQATADKTFFIDDSPNNCAAAEALGIHTLCPQNNEDWIPALKAYLNM